MNDNLSKTQFTLIQGGKSAKPSPKGAPSDTFCDYCWTDPGPSGDCDCPPGMGAGGSQ